MGRRAFRFFLILCLLLMASARVGRAMAIEPPALVPAKSAIVDDIDNLMLKYDLDQRRVVLLHDYNAWNRAALAFNREYTGRDLAKFPQLLAAGRAEQAQLARTLKQYNTQADTFRADVGKLRFKPEAARVIHGLCALAKRLGWSKAKLADLYNQLITLDSEKDPDVTPDQIRQIWQDIAKESLDADNRGREVRFLLRTPLPPNRTCGFTASGSPVNRPSSGTDRRVDGPWLVNTGPVR